MDIRLLDGKEFAGVDLLAAGVPCPPFSVAGRQLGADDERDMFPAALEIVKAAKPRAVLFENVPGFATAKFESYRRGLLAALSKMGYQPDWRILQAANFGAAQLRPRFVLVALKPADAEHFSWPAGRRGGQTVGSVLVDLIAENGWHGAESWAARANGIGPTLVGGSKKHGGPDLGPTRAKSKWRELGVDGMGIADAAPAAEAPFDLDPRLTLRMVARLQSFPDTWEFTGGKTAAYRQVGNAFPPAVSKVIGSAIRAALARSRKHLGKEESLDKQMRLFEGAARYRTKRRK